MKECFVTHRFNAKSRVLLPMIEAIMVDYGRQGYDLTVRQLHYRLNAQDPELYPNTLKSYKMLVGLLTNGRYGGLLDWKTLVDRGRNARKNSVWDGPKSFFKDVPYWFEYDKWQDQPCYIELMAEKDAATGICSPICSELGIAFTANKGYTSSSAMYRTAKRFKAARNAGKKCVLLYIGDHDPSGIQMTEDVTERLRLLAGESITSAGVSIPDIDIEIDRVMLNIEQVKEYELQENFAKDSDSRTPAYVQEFGESCWEMDAIDPHVLVALIKEAVNKRMDSGKWDEAIETEKRMRNTIKNHCDKFGKKGRKK